MERDTASAPRLRRLVNQQGELVEYEVVEPTCGTDWEGLRGRRPRVRLKGEEKRSPLRNGGGV